ncbi:MAG: hypothetical protein GF311_24505 [Candidatus Lokiarchaeota archaeon]|nr:hypothetical protein [Candidatus Lokiarchaeota archaeon]
MAILFEELKAKNSNFPNYEIVASDINAQAIKNAKEGIYGEHAIHETPQKYLKKYFTKISNDPPKYQINLDIRNKVKFINEDITICHKKSQRYDIILCRNFIIYINLISRKHLIRNLKTYLNNGGLLILGKTERLNNEKGIRLIDPVNRFYMKGKTSFSTEEVEIKTPELKNLSKLEERIKKDMIEKTNSITLHKNEADVKASKSIVEKKKKAERSIGKIKISELIEKPNDLIDLSNILSKPSKSDIHEQQKKELEKFRTKINKELFFLKQQRKKLNQAIMKFEKEKRIFREQKKAFENKLLLFEKEKEYIKRKWESYEMKNELLRIEKEAFKKQVENFHHNRRNLHKEKQNKKLSQKQHTPTKGFDYKFTKDYILPLGKYIIVSSRNTSKHTTKKISIHGIGSTYVLVLYDKSNQIYAMSHIMYSNPKKNQNKDRIENKHQYAETAISFLIKKMLIKGASEKLSSFIFGGAQISNKKYKSVEEILNSMKSELKKYNIPIKREFIGGLYPRDIKLNIKKQQISIHFGETMKEIKL